MHTLAMAISAALETTTMPTVLPPSRRADSLLSCTVVGGTQSAALSRPWVMILISPWLPPLRKKEVENTRGAPVSSFNQLAIVEFHFFFFFLRHVK